MNPLRAKSHLTRKQWDEFARVALQSVDLSGEVLMRYQLGKGRNRNPVKLKGRNDLVTGCGLGVLPSNEAASQAVLSWP